MNIARISPRYAPSVGQEHRLWRQAGCGMTCIYPLHAPAAHEEYGREQAINEIRFCVCCETRSNRVDDLVSCEGAAERNITFTDAVTAPSADLRS